MSNHTFTATFAGLASESVAKVKGEIEKHGGTFNGDETAGGFMVPTPPLGTVKGTYTISGQDFLVTITDKPFLLPGGAIEAQVRKSLAT